MNRFGQCFTDRHGNYRLIESGSALRRKHRFGVLPCLFSSAFTLAAATFAALGDETTAQSEKAQTSTVSKTYNAQTFDYQIQHPKDRGGFVVYRVTYPSPVVTKVKQNNTVPAALYIPKQLKAGIKYPAVICLHILNGNEELTDLMCSSLASRNILAISFKLPYYGERGRTGIDMTSDANMFLDAMSQALEDIRRTVDLLASRPEINPDQIGVAGISLGGIVSAAAAEAEPRLHRACLILAGGDIVKIIHHAHETGKLSKMLKELPSEELEKIEARIATIDPLAGAPTLCDRARNGAVLMINAGSDEVVPRECTEKLAEALGIADQVTWMKDRGHYTVMAELPQVTQMMTDFFVQDLPESARQTAAQSDAKSPNAALRPLTSLLGQILSLLNATLDAEHCHQIDATVSFPGDHGKTIESNVRFVRGVKGTFSLQCKVPEIGDVAFGQCEYPWMIAGEKVFVGTKNPNPKKTVLTHIDPQNLMKLRIAAGIAGGIAMTPEMLQQWTTIEEEKTTPNGDKTATAAQVGRTFNVAVKDSRKFSGKIRFSFAADGKTPTAIELNAARMQGKITIHQWQINTPAEDASFTPPKDLPQVAVEQADLDHMFGAVVNCLAERLDGGHKSNRGKTSEAVAVIDRDPKGHGILCQSQGKQILILSGTPEQMGTAHGTLMRGVMQKMIERFVYTVGAADTFRSGTWFFDQMNSIQERASPYIDARFITECDAMAKSSGISPRDARYANLVPERFHCSGVALKGKATTGGRVLHARVLDYMCGIGLQDAAALMVFMPEGRNAWLSVGYAGFIGTVTAMNEKGVGIGEMGGRGESDWDGMPMTILLRDAMERASTADEAVEILRKAPRTCEYYYVVSDKSGTIYGLHCTPKVFQVIKPGEQNPALPHVPEDTVLISGPDRAPLLSQRIQASFGKIDVPRLIEIIKRPVAMASNLHDAVFTPETLDVWFADAGRDSPACNEPYAHANLRELIQFYRDQATDGIHQP